MKSTQPYSQEDLQTRFNEMDKSHPRLFTKTTNIPDLGAAEKFIAMLINEAYRLESVPPLTREMDGRRMLHVSREALRRISTLAIAWMRIRDAGLLKRAEAELLAVCSFSDWNPAHYLDTAEMSLAVAIGYDWLYNDLPEASRLKIGAALWTLGLEMAVEDIWPFSAENNWGQVCHAGMCAAAAVLAEEHPRESFYIIDRAVRHVSMPMQASYSPDGAYPEGPMYWGYGTSFNVVFFMTMNSVFGTLYGLDELPGFIESANYVRHATDPSDGLFSYADCRYTKRNELSLLWFADMYPDRFGGHDSTAFFREWTLVTQSPASLKNNRLAPLLVAFGLDWQKNSTKRVGSDEITDLDWHGRGNGEIVTMRSAWNNPSAWYVGIKSGTPSANHGHMDAGSFVLNARGEQWALDLGLEEYGHLEQAGFNLWQNEQNGQRWELFRYGKDGHNIIVVNDARQVVAGSATVLDKDLNVESPSVTIDLSRLYDDVDVVHREFVFENRKSLKITDTFEGLKAGDVVRWQMVTDAIVKPFNGGLLLQKNDKRLELYADTEVDWHVVEADTLTTKWDAPVDNIRIIRFERTADATGTMTHTVVAK